MFIHEENKKQEETPYLQSQILTTAICKICYEHKVDSCLACGHVYCGQCLEKFILENNRCPLGCKLSGGVIRLFYP